MEATFYGASHNRTDNFEPKLTAIEHDIHS